jgi:hypothetical protein
VSMVGNASLCGIRAYRDMFELNPIPLPTPKRTQPHILFTGTLDYPLSCPAMMCHQISWILGFDQVATAQT